MASRYSPSLAKNMMRRSLRAVVDPHPRDDEIADALTFFRGQCVYCGKQLALGSKDMHLDHLDSETVGGTNHISNRVPACANCNEVEKRELSWEEFLTIKVAIEGVRKERRDKIDAWISRFPSDARILNGEVRGQVDASINQVVAAYDAALERLRALRRQRP